MENQKKRMEMLNKVLTEGRKIEETYGKTFFNQNARAVYYVGAFVVSEDVFFSIAIIRNYTLDEFEKELKRLGECLLPITGDCRFKVTKIVDTRKHGSDIELKKEYVGQRENNKVYYTDKAEVQWVFFIGDTCELVNN